MLTYDDQDKRGSTEYTQKCCTGFRMFSGIILDYTILYYTILYYTILYYIILYYTILYYTILYYTILYCTVLYSTLLYYTILYYTILYSAIQVPASSLTFLPDGHEESCVRWRLDVTSRR